MLTEHFSYNEMTRSAWAERNGVEAVNYGVHGVGGSKHLSGEAVDIRIPDVETGRAYYRWILRNVDFDQLLFEYRRDGAMWLHCSVLLDKRENRHQAFPNYKV